MTWVAYHSDLSEVVVFEPDGHQPPLTELRARRYAMENHMDVIDLPDGCGLRETINAHLREPKPSLDPEKAARVEAELERHSLARRRLFGRASEIQPLRKTS